MGEIGSQNQQSFALTMRCKNTLVRLKNESLLPLWKRHQVDLVVNNNKKSIKTKSLRNKLACPVGHTSVSQED